MPVETATYVSDLVTSNPLVTDGVGQGDDHIRLVKTALRNTFPNVVGQASGSQADMSHGFVPIGGIIMWSGLIAAIPAGFVLCDGTNGSPNLRNSFIVGAGGAYSPGDTFTSNISTGSSTIKWFALAFIMRLN